MKSGCPKKIIIFLLGLLLLASILPAWAQAPGPPHTLPQLYEFDRKLCPVCRESELIIREVKNLYPGQFAGRRLYIDEHQPLFRQYQVAIVPTQVFLDPAGKEVFRHEGVFPKDQLIQKLRELKFIRDGEK
jgi:thioredoxin-like negative regulator of GroEL